MPESVDTGVVVINADNAKYFYHAEDPYDFSNIEITGPEPGETYVEVLALINLPYFIDHRLGLEFAGEELGVKTKFVGPVDYDMTAMVNTLEQIIAEKPGWHPGGRLRPRPEALHRQGRRGRDSRSSPWTPRSTARIASPSWAPATTTPAAWAASCCAKRSAAPARWPS